MSRVGIHTAATMSHKHDNSPVKYFFSKKKKKAKILNEKEYKNCDHINFMSPICEEMLLTFVLGCHK